MLPSIRFRSGVEEVGELVSGIETKLSLNMIKNKITINSHASGCSL